MEFTEEEKGFLLKLARRSIQHYLSKGSELHVGPGEVPSKKLVEDGACFVTLRKGGKLRGCIGSLEAHRPLFMDVVENALAAALGDPRFHPVTLPELESIKISISVLTKPVEMPVKSPEELLERLVPHKHGLIIQQGVARATFLPVVWEELPEKEDFIRHLSIKASLGPEGWKDPETRYFVYEAIEISE